MQDLTVLTASELLQLRSQINDELEKRKNNTEWIKIYITTDANLNKITLDAKCFRLDKIKCSIEDIFEKYGRGKLFYVNDLLYFIYEDNRDYEDFVSEMNVELKEIEKVVNENRHLL